MQCNISVPPIYTEILSAPTTQ